MCAHSLSKQQTCFKHLDCVDAAPSVLQGTCFLGKLEGFWHVLLCPCFPCHPQMQRVRGRRKENIPGAHRNTEVGRYAHTDTQTHTDTHTHTQKAQTNTHRHKHTNTDTNKHRRTQTHRHTDTKVNNPPPLQKVQQYWAKPVRCITLSMKQPLRKSASHAFLKKSTALAPSGSTPWPWYRVLLKSMPNQADVGTQAQQP